jgi:hypothetical protein
MKRSDLIIFVATSRTETALAAERNKLKAATMVATKESPAKRGITAVDQFVHVLDDCRAWMQKIKDMLIMIRKNRL